MNSNTPIRCDTVMEGASRDRGRQVASGQEDKVSRFKVSGFQGFRGFSSGAWRQGRNDRGTEIKGVPNVSSGRLGSPPPELPNHEWRIRRTAWTVNVTLVIRALAA